MNYGSKHVATIFEVGPQTVRDWAAEFSAYLSPNCNPGDRRARLFGEDDLRVIALIKSMKNDGKFFKDIHLALASGERGELPSLPEDNELLDLAASQAGLALFNQFNALIERVNQLEVLVRDSSNERVIELQNRLDDANQEIGKLKTLLELSRIQSDKE